MGSASDIRAGGAFVELYANRAALTAGLKAALGETQQWAQKVASLGAGMAGIGAAITGPLAYAAKAFANNGSALDDMSQRTGASIEALSGLQYAAELSGTSLDTLAGGLRKMALTVDGALTGNKAAADTLKTLGLSIEDVRGKKPEELFSLFADRVAGISDPIHRGAVAMDIFGKSGVELVPLLALGRQGIADLAQEADALGLTMSTTDAQAAATFGDALDRAYAACRGFANTIGAAVAPALQAAVDLFTAVAKPIQEFIRANQALLTGALVAGVALTGIGVSLTALGLATTFTATAVAGLAALFSMIAAFAALPITWFFLAGAAAVAFVGHVTGAFSGLYAMMKNTLDGATQTVQGIANALKAGNIQAAWDIMGASLNIAWLNIVNSLKSTWRGFTQYMIFAAIDAATKTLNAFQDLQFATTGTVSNTANTALAGLAGLKLNTANTNNAAASADGDALDAARAKFAALLASVAPTDPRKSFAAIPELAAVAATSQQTKTQAEQLREQSTGTFSARGAEGLGQGSVALRTVKATETTAKNTAIIAKAAEKGLVFGT